MVFTKHLISIQKQLEKAVCDYIGVKYAIATHCYTLALHLACGTLGFKEGDEVICTDFELGVNFVCH